MEQKKTINGKIDNALESLDGIQRATPQPWLYARVKARLQREERTVWESIGSFLSKPAIAMAGLGLILVLNVFVLHQQGNLQGATAVTASPSTQLTDSESIIASNSSFEYENLVQP
ncbi:MAG: hypothetical protein EOO01_06295 [Chitinophagaceae bacterium]|nr:MAG: hypothetical protein EOO01_06295 [Chitinophagaceae bacterium]